MIAVLIDVLLVLTVLFAWLAAFGLLRLYGPFAPLHAVTLAATGGNLTLLCAALLADGPTDRVAKIALLLVASLLNGAAVSHATARGLAWRRRWRSPE